MKGTYTLLVELETATKIEFGAKGTRGLDLGWYAYTGSAFGRGGFSRVARHARVAARENDARHWHIDYLLGSPESRLDDDVRTAGEDVECEVVRNLDGEVSPISGIGASDCNCGTHLHFASEKTTLESAVRRAHELERN
ncbi:DUF123 domain-containing protein [Haladaptatus pallidirubidus]|uniref:DUF123 domain-containing protein n=1 Tax=Haladaptatus pallidirubidus TaxID=1008152 RepID=A0AAV3UBA9_9EURY|nr:GIY-YIG nuclease family protein [Haladaptatus pallidirubidus]